MYKVGIVGLGHVGSCMQELFPDAITYDEPKHIGERSAINDCDFVFVCVPTPQAEDGHCDTTIVEDVLTWLDPKQIIIIRSTIPVGFTDHCNIKKRMLSDNSVDTARVIFQPEYYGETVAHPFANPHNRSWITLGGALSDTTKVADLYQTVFTSELIINQVDARTAELAKYMENAFYATKVTFCNQFYDLARALNVDFHKLTETWLLDPRIGRSHTDVYPSNRGYAGACLPKDVSAIISQGDMVGVDLSLLKAAQEYNTKLRKDIEHV